MKCILVLWSMIVQCSQLFWKPMLNNILNTYNVINTNISNMLSIFLNFLNNMYNRLIIYLLGDILYNI